MSNPEARRGRSSLIRGRNCGRYSGGHRRTKAPCNLPSAMGSFQTLPLRMTTKHQEESGHMYNQAGVDALDDVRAVVASFGAPIAFRKLYGILNAMEMHVEET